MLVGNPVESRQYLSGACIGVRRCTEIEEERPGLLAFDERHGAIGQDVGQIAARFGDLPS